MDVETIETRELGDRSYVAHDGRRAVVVDPQRDLDRIESVLRARGLRVDAVLETHIHNDYVTGGHELARRTGAVYVVNAADEVRYERRGVTDGDEFTVGELVVRALATPGHTDTHLSYVVMPNDTDQVGAVFSGGCLLYGGVGRTDLVDSARTEELTRHQYRSAGRLVAELDDTTDVYPTHGFGSFCSSGETSDTSASSIAAERRDNDAVTIDEEDEFVTRLVSGLTAYPSYYGHIAPLNRRGPSAPDLTPVDRLEPERLRERIEAGEWVVDLRDRKAYAAGHLSGTVAVELGDQFSTYLGWLAPWQRPVTLIGASAGQIADAQRQLVRIGIDRPAGALVGTPEECGAAVPLRSYERVTFAAVPAPMPAGEHVLDVRRHDERARGAIPGSVHMPVHELLDRLDELPAGRLWVHCTSGFRAATAASILDRARRDVVLIDDDYDKAVESGLATR